MRQIIKEITDRFLSKLPAGQGYFTMTELAGYDYPGFFLELVSHELNRKFNESIPFPQNEWIKPNSEKVKRAWSQFKESITTEVSLPSDKAAPIFEHCVEELVNTLVEPRKYVPKILFGDQNSLTSDEVEANARRLVVYEHFPNALIRYMFKRNFDTIGIEKGTVVISQIDDKLTENYTPLNWVQLLEPWFTLMNNEIDSQLLSRFFREKNRTGWGNRFQKVNKSIKRNEIIDILSEPESASDAETAQTTPETVNTVSEKTTVWPEEEKPVKKQKPVKKEEELADNPGPSGKVNASPKIDKQADQSEVPIWKQYTEEDSDDESLIGQFYKDNQKNPEITLADELAPKEKEKQKIDFTDYSDEEDEEDLEDAGEDLKNLFKYVNDQSDYFVHELFGGDDNTFMQALDDIASFENWNKASKYITNEIFRRNMIDIYSEPALDFTDTLQNYFLEKSKSQK